MDKAKIEDMIYTAIRKVYGYGDEADEAIDYAMDAIEYYEDNKE